MIAVHTSSLSPYSSASRSFISESSSFLANSALPRRAANTRSLFFCLSSEAIPAALSASTVTWSDMPSVAVRCLSNSSKSSRSTKCCCRSLRRLTAIGGVVTTLPRPPSPFSSSSEEDDGDDEQLLVELRETFVWPCRRRPEDATAEDLSAGMALDGSGTTCGRIIAADGSPPPPTHRLSAVGVAAVATAVAMSSSIIGRSSGGLTEVVFHAAARRCGGHRWLCDETPACRRAEHMLRRCDGVQSLAVLPTRTHVFRA